MDDKASNQMKSCAVHNFSKMTSVLNLVQTELWEMQLPRAPLLVVKRTGILILTQTHYYEHRGT